MVAKWNTKGVFMLEIQEVYPAEVDKLYEDFFRDLAEKISKEVGDTETRILILQEKCDSMRPFEKLHSFLHFRLKEKLGIFSSTDLEFEKMDSIYEDRMAEYLNEGEHKFVIFINDGISPVWSNNDLYNFCNALPEGTRYLWIHPWGERGFRTESDFGLLAPKPHVKDEEIGFRYLSIGCSDLEEHTLLEDGEWQQGRRIRYRKHFKKYDESEIKGIPLETKEEVIFYFQRCCLPHEVRELIGIMGCFPDGHLTLPFLTTISNIVSEAYVYKAQTQTEVAEFLASGVLEKRDVEGVFAFRNRTPEVSKAFLSILPRTFIRHVLQVALHLQRMYPQEVTPLGLNLETFGVQVLEGKEVEGSWNYLSKFNLQRSSDFPAEHLPKLKEEL